MIDQVSCWECGKVYDVEVADDISERRREGEIITIRRCPRCGTKNAIVLNFTVNLSTTEVDEDDDNIYEDFDDGEPEEVYEE